MQGDKHSSQSIACMSGCDSEMARLFGIDFFSVLSRGSQFRVEAVMLRVAKPLPHRYILVSPSRDQVRLLLLVGCPHGSFNTPPPPHTLPQVASQAAMECTPLIMEPVSRLYTSPVVVLDFQSLYPSVVCCLIPSLGMCEHVLMLTFCNHVWPSLLADDCLQHVLLHLSWALESSRGTQ